MLEFFTYNLTWLWTILAIGSAGLLVFYLLKGQTFSPAAIRPEECAVMTGKKVPTFVDIRTQEAFNEGTVPQARWIAFSELADKAPKQVSKTKPVILIADSDGVARKACATLNGLGYSEVYFLAGGMFTWSKAEFPIKSKS